MLGLDHNRIPLQAAHDCTHLVHLLGLHQVGLVQHDCRAELDLLDEQALDVVFLQVVEQALSAVELVDHPRAIHDGDDVVERQRRTALDGVVAELRDRVGDGHGLANARRFDDDVVELARSGDFAELGGQVLGKRAADAAVRQRYHAVGLREPAFAYQALVDVDLADVVHDDGRAHVAIVRQDIVEKRRLPRSQVTGHEDDLHGFAPFGHAGLLRLPNDSQEV